MTTDLTVYTGPQDGLSLADLGSALAKSGYFQDARDASQAIVKVLAGRELGLGPVAAMTGIYIVKGRVTMSANLIAAQIKRSGRYDYRVRQLDDAGAVLTFFERDGSGWREIGVSSFTADDAKAAGLWGSSDPWKKTPRNMLFARAMSNGAKWYTPDIFTGPVYTPDELNGPEVVEAPPAPAPAVTVVDTKTGEILDAPEGTRVLGVASEVQQAYSKAGALTLRFVLTCPEDELGGEETFTILYRNAPDIALQLENGDEVIVDGSMGTYKGAEVVNASAVQPVSGYDLWQTRAAQPETAAA